MIQLPILSHDRSIQMPVIQALYVSSMLTVTLYSLHPEGILMI